MSLNTLEKRVLTEIPEEDQQTTEGDDNLMVHSNPRKLTLPIDTLRFTEGPSGLGDIRRKSSDDITFMVSHGSHMNKPVMKFETTLTVNLYQIKEVFEKVCKKREFEIVDDEGDQITAVYKKALRLKDLILSCIPSSSRNAENLTAIRLHCKTNKVSCVRRITLKALLGDINLANDLFLDFEKEIETYNGRRAGFSPMTNGISFFTDNVLSTSLNMKSSKYLSLREENHGETDESIISTQNLESSSLYEFRKILSSEQYSIGKKVAEFVRDFAVSYKSIKESAELLPQPMESVYLLVNEITETFFADFNYGKSETKQMMPYCKIAVEKFIFDKVYTQLFSMYLTKCEPKIRKFEAKAQKINEISGSLEQLKYLDISPKFWLIRSDKIDESNKLRHDLQEHETPYLDAINELSKISKLKSPREKLGVLLMMHSLMKSAVVDFHKGKEEMYSMDDELPIMIYILLRANLKNGFAEFNFIDDYVQFDPSLESEKRLMTNLKVSLQYIADEWEYNSDLQSKESNTV